MLSPAIISLPFIILFPVAIFAAYIMLAIPNLLITFCIGISKDLFRLQRGETGSIISCIIGACCGGVLYRMEDRDNHERQSRRLPYYFYTCNDSLVWNYKR